MEIFKVIVDHITHWRLIPAILTRNFKTALAWIETNMNAALAPGRYPVGSESYARVQVYQPKLPSQGRFENHRKYFDVQFVVAGRERIFWTKPRPVQKEEAYDEVKDIEFFETVNPITTASSILLEPGIFVILGPSDWHMPGIIPDAGMVGNGANTIKPESVQKIVVKVPVE